VEHRGDAAVSDPPRELTRAWPPISYGQHLVGSARIPASGMYDALRFACGNIGPGSNGSVIGAIDVLTISRSTTLNRRVDL